MLTTTAKLTFKAITFSSTQPCLALLSKRPPRPGIAPLHEIHCREEDVDHARIMTGTRLLTESLIHPIRILSDQLLRVVDADDMKVPSCGLANIGELFEAGDGVAIGMFHETGCRTMVFHFSGAARRMSLR